MWSAARSWTVLMSICWSSPAASSPRTFEVPPLPVISTSSPSFVTREPTSALSVVTTASWPTTTRAAPMCQAPSPSCCRLAYRTRDAWPARMSAMPPYQPAAPSGETISSSSVTRAALLGHDQRDRMERDVGARQQLARDQRAVDDDAARGRSRTGHRSRRTAPAPRSGRGSRAHRPGRGMALDQLRVLADGGAQVGQDDAGLGGVRWQVRLELRHVEQQLDVARQRVERGAAPLLLLAGGRRGGRSALPPSGTEGAQPVRLVEPVADAPDRIGVEGRCGLREGHRLSRPRLPSGAG